MDKTLQQQIDEQFREDHREMVEAYKEEERREAEHRKWYDQRRLDAMEAEEYARYQEDERRVEALRSHPDPVVRSAGEKIWAARDSQEAAAEEQWETGGDGEEEAEREAAAEAARSERLARDPEPDPGWLNRWEREGTLTALTPAEREKLREIDRQDPFGRGQREMFLPREVLAIRAHSDRMVEERQMVARQAEAREAPAQEKKAQVPPWHRIAEAAPDLQDWAAHMDHLESEQRRVAETGIQDPLAAMGVGLEDEFTQDNHQMVADWRAGRREEIDIDHEVARVREGLAEQQKMHEVEAQQQQHDPKPQGGGGQGGGNGGRQKPELEQDQDDELELE